MKRYMHTLAALLAALLISACASTGKEANPRPAWIDNPGAGVSASAGMHIRGRAAQEELAIQRAREEFSKRYGVNIQSLQVFTTTVANDKSSTTGTHVSQEETRQQDIKAVVKAKWLDPETDTLWVWLVPSD